MPYTAQQIFRVDEGVHITLADEARGGEAMRCEAEPVERLAGVHIFFDVELDEVSASCIFSFDQNSAAVGNKSYDKVDNDRAGLSFVNGRANQRRCHPRSPVNVSLFVQPGQSKDSVDEDALMSFRQCCLNVTNFAILHYHANANNERHSNEHCCAQQ